MSIVAGESPDVVAALEGGSTFDQRLNELRRSTEIYQQAVTDLRLGKEARVAWDEAAADREAAKAILAAAGEEAKAIIDRAKSDTQESRERARELAKQTQSNLDEAKKKASEAEAYVAAAANAASVAKTKADEIVAQAKALADKISADVDARVLAVAKREDDAERKLTLAKDFIAGVKSLAKPLK